jgi:hypothetical protein
MTIAAEQSGLLRGVAAVLFLAVAGLYLYVRDQRNKKRRSHRP